MTFFFFKAKAIFILFLLTHCSQGLFKNVPFSRQPAQIIHLNRIGGLTCKCTVLYFCFHSLTGLSLFFSHHDKSTNNIAFGLWRKNIPSLLSFFLLSVHSAPFLFLSFGYRQPLFYGDPLFNSVKLSRNLPHRFNCEACGLKTLFKIRRGVILSHQRLRQEDYEIRSTRPDWDRELEPVWKIQTYKQANWKENSFSPRKQCLHK